MRNIVIVILIGIMFGMYGYYTPKVDHEIMGHQFWLCYKDKVKNTVLKSEEREKIVKDCKGEILGIVWAL
jgi:hypothetical protein